MNRVSLFVVPALFLFAVPAFAQESLTDRVSKLEKRLDSLETKMDRVLDFISANYGPNTKTPTKAAAVCVDGVCAVPTTSVSSSASSGRLLGGNLFGGHFLSRLRIFKGGCQ